MVHVTSDTMRQVVGFFFFFLKEILCDELWEGKSPRCRPQLTNCVIYKAASMREIFQAATFSGKTWAKDHVIWRLQLQK